MTDRSPKEAILDDISAAYNRFEHLIDDLKHEGDQIEKLKTAKLPCTSSGYGSKQEDALKLQDLFFSYSGVGMRHVREMLSIINKIDWHFEELKKHAGSDERGRLIDKYNPDAMLVRLNEAKAEFDHKIAGFAVAKPDLVSYKLRRAGEKLLEARPAPA